MKAKLLSRGSTYICQSRSISEILRVLLGNRKVQLWLRYCSVKVIRLFHNDCILLVSWQQLWEKLVLVTAQTTWPTTPSLAGCLLMCFTDWCVGLSFRWLSVFDLSFWSLKSSTLCTSRWSRMNGISHPVARGECSKRLSSGSGWRWVQGRGRREKEPRGSMLVRLRRFALWTRIGNSLGRLSCLESLSVSRFGFVLLVLGLSTEECGRWSSYRQMVGPRQRIGGRTGRYYCLIEARAWPCTLSVKLDRNLFLAIKWLTWGFPRPFWWSQGKEEGFLKKIQMNGAKEENESTK